MLGRLPLRHRITVWIAGLLSFAGVGAWLTHRSEIPLVWSSGPVLATLVGALAIASFLHLLGAEPEPHRRSTNSAR